jgi:hypothetical protein
MIVFVCVCVCVCVKHARGDCCAIAVDAVRSRLVAAQNKGVAVFSEYGRAQACAIRLMYRVGLDRIHTPYMTAFLVTSLPKTPYIHRLYMVLENPINV